MVALFSFLLFWFGFIVTIVGTIAVAAKSTYREPGIAGTLLFFVMSGAILMGSAGKSLAYSPHPAVLLSAGATLWVVLIVSLVIVSIKPSITTRIQEDV